MTDHTTDEPGWHVLREHIREATPARVERHWLDKPLQFAAAFIAAAVAIYAVVAS